MKRLMIDMMIVPIVLMVLMLASGAGSCQSSINILNIDSTALHVGIAGEVRKSPIMPVERPGVDNSAPLAGASITIQHEPGGVVGRVVSDSSGRLFVELEPGTYTLSAGSFDNNPFPVPPGPQQVVVPANGIISVRLDYDTGIR